MMRYGTAIDRKIRVRRKSLQKLTKKIGYIKENKAKYGKRSRKN
jgi:hypothetical protein